MERMTLDRLLSPAVSWIALFIFFFAGCDFRRAGLPEQKIFQFEGKSIVVAGFRAALSPGEKPEVVRNPLSGAIFNGQPVEKEVIDRMTDALFMKMLETKRYEFISPDQAEGILSTLVSSDAVLDDAELFKRLGKAVSSDAVLVGYIYRWIEREGSDYAVHRPASVAFDLCLLRTDDGVILWKGRFDKSQKSLSENLLDLNTFMKAGGKWMTAEYLANLGLQEILEKFPKGETGHED